MKKILLIVTAVSILATACQAPPKPVSKPASKPVSKADYYRMPLSIAYQEEVSELEQVLRQSPNVKWERAEEDAAATDYWVVPGGDPFYLFRTGLQFIGGESALRYTTRSDGFDLLTIEKKPGIQHHPACPGWAPDLHCIDEHTLLIVTSISCSKTACDYDFIVIDYFNKSPFFGNPPAIKEIIDYVLDSRHDGSYIPFSYAGRFNEKHRTSGNITSENPLWLNFIQERFTLIQEKIDYAVAKNEVRIIGD